MAGPNTKASLKCGVCGHDFFDPESILGTASAAKAVEQGGADAVEGRTVEVKCPKCNVLADQGSTAYWCPNTGCIHHGAEPIGVYRPDPLDQLAAEAQAEGEDGTAWERWVGWVTKYGFDLPNRCQRDYFNAFLAAECERAVRDHVADAGKMAPEPDAGRADEKMVRYCQIHQRPYTVGPTRMCPECDTACAGRAEGEYAAPYGYCPICGAKGINRERCINGFDACEQGHKYASKSAKPQPPTPRRTAREVAEEVLCMAELAASNQTAIDAIEAAIERDRQQRPEVRDKAP